jgi:hypothetical protein
MRRQLHERRERHGDERSVEPAEHRWRSRRREHEGDFSGQLTGHDQHGPLAPARDQRGQHLGCDFEVMATGAGAGGAGAGLLNLSTVNAAAATLTLGNPTPRWRFPPLVVCPSSPARSQTTREQGQTLTGTSKGTITGLTNG